MSYYNNLPGSCEYIYRMNMCSIPHFITLPSSVKCTLIKPLIKHKQITNTFYNFFFDIIIIDTYAWSLISKSKNYHTPGIVFGPQTPQRTPIYTLFSCHRPVSHFTLYTLDPGQARFIRFTTLDDVAYGIPLSRFALVDQSVS